MISGGQTKKLLTVLLCVGQPLLKYVRGIYKKRCKKIADQHGIQIAFDKCSPQDFQERLKRPGWCIVFYAHPKGEVPKSSNAAGFCRNISASFEAERNVEIRDILKPIFFRYSFCDDWDSMPSTNFDIHDPSSDEAVCTSVAGPTALEKYDYFSRKFDSLLCFAKKLEDDFVCTIQKLSAFDFPAQHQQNAVLSSADLDIPTKGQVAVITFCLDVVQKVEDLPLLTRVKVDAERRFQKYVLNLVKEYGGKRLPTKYQTHSFVFHGAEFRKRALMIGIQIVAYVDVANLESVGNERISVMASGSEGAIDQETGIDSMIDFTNIQIRREGLPGKFMVTDLLLQSIKRELRLRFLYKNRFYDFPVYVYDKNRSGSPSKEFLEGTWKHAYRKGRGIKKILDGNFFQDARTMGLMKQYFFELFDIIDEYCFWFKDVDRQMGKIYLRMGLKIASQLINLESDVWAALKTVTPHLHGAGNNFELQSLQKNICSYRVDPSLALTVLQTRLNYELSGVGKRKATVKDFKKHLYHALEADELDREMAITELNRNHFDAMMHLVSENRERELIKRLKKLVWENTELFPKTELLRLFIDQGEMHFKVLGVVSNLNNIRCEKTVEDVLARYLVQPSPENVDLVLRLLATRHRDNDIRVWATNRLKLSSVWKLTYQAKTSLKILYNLGQRLRQEGREDYNKIFFDCTCTRVLRKLKTLKSEEDARKVSKIIYFYNEMEFLIEDAYFIRYDGFLRIFQECLERMNIPDKLLQDIRDNLNKRHNNAEDSTTKAPPQMDGIPLPLQRQLAGLPHYYPHFINAPDKRIAMEAFRHVTAKNVVNLLKRDDINEDLFRYLLDQPQYFVRQINVQLALTNVKCPPRWAEMQLKSWFGNPAGKKHIEAFPINKVHNPEIKRIIMNWKTKVRSSRLAKS